MVIGDLVHVEYRETWFKGKIVGLTNKTSGWWIFKTVTPCALVEITFMRKSLFGYERNSEEEIILCPLSDLKQIDKNIMS